LIVKFINESVAVVQSLVIV